MKTYAPKPQSDPGETSKRFIKVAGDSKIQIRMVPPTMESGEVFFPRRMHYNLPVEDKLRAVECLKTFKQQCPACDFFYKYKKNEEFEAATNAMKPVIKFFAAFVMRDRESEGIKVWGFPYKLFTQLKDLYNEQLKAGETPFTGDAEGNDGHDLIIKRVGSGRTDTEYSYTPLSKRSNLVDVCPGWKSDGFTSISEVVDRTVLSPEQFLSSFKSALAKLGVNAEEVLSSKEDDDLPF